MTNNISKLANSINVRLNALLKKTKKNNIKANTKVNNKGNTKNNRWRKSYNDEEKKYYYTSKTDHKSVWDLPPGAVVNNSPRKFYRIGNSPNWHKVKNSDGTTWYENKKSKELSWNQPAGTEFTNVNPAQEVPEVAEPEPNGKNNRWRKSYNDEEKKYYYTSKSEQKSVWDLPPEAVINNSPRQFYKIGNSANWVKVKDNDGMTWYKNKKSKELSWTQPTDQVFTNISPPQEVPEVAEPEPNTVPKNTSKNTANNDSEYLVGSSKNWQKVQNGKGETWYVNNKTSTSQWNTPVGVVFTNVNPKQKLAKNVPEPNKANNDVEYLIGSSANWQKIQNGKGETWYVDNKTTQSQWNAPAGVVFTNVNPKEKIFRKNIQEPQNIGAIYKKYLIAKSNDGWEKIENERGEKWYSNKALQKAEWYAPKGVVFTNVKTREESKNALEEPGGAPPKNN
jgi:hypothetical protein